MNKRSLITVLLLAALILAALPAPIKAQGSGDCAAGFRLFDHELLLTDPVCVPEHPQRVAALDMTIIELMLIAEIQPAIVSRLVFGSYLRMHPELEPTFTKLYETAKDVGYTPNLEAVLEAQPDLIIAPSDLVSVEIHAQLNAIAPTVIYDPIPGDWRTRLIFAGDVLGITDTVDGLLADYDARIAELKQALGDQAAETEVSLVRVFPDQIGLVVAGASAAAVLQSVGFARPEAQSVDYDYVLKSLDGRPEVLISAEELQLADGDIIFVFGDATALKENPLWQALDAVKNGRAFEVGYYWWGDDLLSAHDMLDDLFQYVAKVEAKQPNPFEHGIETTNEATPEA